MDPGREAMGAWGLGPGASLSCEDFLHPSHVQPFPVVCNFQVVVLPQGSPLDQILDVLSNMFPTACVKTHVHGCRVVASTQPKWAPCRPKILDALSVNLAQETFVREIACTWCSETSPLSWCICRFIQFCPMLVKNTRGKDAMILPQT